MVDDVKDLEFCKHVTSAKEQTCIYALMLFYAYVHVRRNLERHQQSSTQVLHVRDEVWHTMHIDDFYHDSPEPGPAIRVAALH